MASIRSYLDFEKPVAEIDAKADELRGVIAAGGSAALNDEITKLEAKSQALLKELYGSLTPWQKAMVARHPARPHFKDYINGLIEDFAPLYCEEGGTNVVTQFDKDDVEAAGLVKFDFLGLRTLTVIEHAVRTINRVRATRGETPLDIATLPMDDVKTFELLKACSTTAVFQLESRGMKDLVRRLQPDTFEDIVALVALFRPGPLQSGMVDDFIDRKSTRLNSSRT